MKHNNHKKPSSWRGYTLDELAHQRAINAVKQEMTVEQLSSAYARLSSPNTPLGAEISAGEGVFSRFNNNLYKVMTYATYCAQALKVARRVRNIIAQFRKK